VALPDVALLVDDVLVVVVGLDRRLYVVVGTAAEQLPVPLEHAARPAFRPSMLAAAIWMASSRESDPSRWRCRSVSAYFEASNDSSTGVGAGVTLSLLLHEINIPGPQIRMAASILFIIFLIIV
jgi:hypothetical protein